MARRRKARTESRRAFPWIEAVPGLLVGLVFGTFFAATYGQRLGGVSTPGVPFPDGWVYTYTGPSLLVMVLAGAAVVGVGVVWASERQFWNYVVIGGGVGIAVLGTTFLALEKVEARPDAVVYRTWWGLSRVELNYSDLKAINDLRHIRPGKRERRALHFETHDGRRGVLCRAVNRSRLWFWASLHVLESAASHGVEIRRGHTDTN